MNKKLLFIPLFAIAFSLTACLPNNDAKQYATPELFFNKANNAGKWRCEYSVTGADYGRVNVDYDYTIKDAFLNVADKFEQTSKFKPTGEKQLTYSLFWTPSNAGPNYATATLYQSGGLIIEHKHALTVKATFYHKTDENTAKTLLDLAQSKIEDNANKREHSKEEAKQKATIYRFIGEIEEGAKLSGQIFDDQFSNGYAAFKDNKNDLLPILDSIEYLDGNDANFDYDRCLELAIGKNIETERGTYKEYAWRVLLLENFDRVVVQYEFWMFDGDYETVELLYIINSEDGRALFNTALTIARIQN